MVKVTNEPNGSKIEFDPLAEKIVPDPTGLPDSVALMGFVGRSTNDRSIRLYIDTSFRSYYEISISDILHSQQLPATQSPLGGRSVVYVRGDAPLRLMQVSAEIEARFLQGPMSSIAMGAAGAPALPSGVKQFVQFGKSDNCPSTARSSCSDNCPGHHRTFECEIGYLTWGAAGMCPANF